MQALKVQNQIRQNAEEISGFFSDLMQWEKDIKVKDIKIQQKKGTSHTPIRGSGTVKIQSTLAQESVSKSHSAAQHTYDIGYEKWKNFDENENENENLLTSSSDENIENPTNLTPAHLLKTIPEVSKVDNNDFLSFPFLPLH